MEEYTLKYMGDLRVNARHERSGTEIITELNFPKNNYTDKEKLIFERTINTCPVLLSLNEEVIKTIKINYI